MLYSLLLASEGSGEDMAVQVTNSRIELEMKRMKKEVNNRNENISILINRYHEECQALHESPPAQLIEIIERRASEEHAKETQSNGR